MKNLLLQALRIGVITGAINAVIVFLLGGSVLDTPYVAPGVAETQPVTTFAYVAFVLTVILIVIGALLLSLLVRWMGAPGIRTWQVLGIIFLILYAIFPFVGPEIASTKAAILVNILHLVAGIPALLYLPRKV